MVMPVTEIIGKRGPAGEWVRNPITPKLTVQSLRELTQDDPTVIVQVRPPEQREMMGDEQRRRARKLLAEIDRKGTVTVTLSRKYQPGARRMLPKRKTFPADKPFRVPVRVALRLLQIEPYCLVFEEVDDGSPGRFGPTALDGPPLPGKVASAQAVEARFEAERAERLRLEREMSEMRALLARLTGDAAPAPTSTTPAEAPADADDDPDADDGNPPLPGGKRR